MYHNCFHTGENILTVDNATDFDLAMIQKSDGINFKSYSDKKLTHASSIYLLTFENLDDADLSNTTFDYYGECLKICCATL